MAYFNHAFSKAFVVKEFASQGTKTADFKPGAFEVVQGWESVACSVTNSIDKSELFYLVQGSFRTNDNIGNNPGHGGYSESVKSKAINPRYVSRLWSSSCMEVEAATVSISVGPACAPCGSNLFLRLDVKGSPALRFLNHNAYAIGDSSGSAAQGNVPGLCCAVDQLYLDPAVALAKASKMLLEDPIIKPFVEFDYIDVTVGGVTTSYSLDEILDGTYTPSTDPITDDVNATVGFYGAWVDTKFGNCSFDTRDFYEKEPVQLTASILDETGNPCNDCGVIDTTPGVMPQTSGETVLRDVLMTEAYMQSPYNQGNPDSARIREIEGSSAILDAIDRDVMYKVYYIQHSIPRLNNPTGTFDNDQYVYKIYVPCNDSDLNTGMDNLMQVIAKVCDQVGNPVQFQSGIDRP